MLGYVTVGANDLSSSERFYAAILMPLGYGKKVGPNGIAFELPARGDRLDGLGAVYVTKPYDGQKATVGNGSMVAFRAATHALVRAIHAAGVAAGGSDEGAPGFRAQYSAHFYVAYLRDPVGNKIAIYCSDPAEGVRL
jgi:catechol 2,3-dioxygenase-like lactoylglutathione lyase family enzyme